MRLKTLMSNFSVIFILFICEYVHYYKHVVASKEV